MKKKVKIIKNIGIRGMLLLTACLGWWGFFYPEYTLVDGTYKMVQESGEIIKDVSPEEFYQQLLKAKPEQIRIKSKLFETLLNLTDGQK